MPPTRILACQSQHKVPCLSRRGRASAPAGRLPPLLAHERPMPTQQRPRGDKTRAACGAWQVADRRREQGAISTAKLRPRHLAAQDPELVTQDELQVLDVQATTTPDERSQQGPEREVEKREGHCRRSSQGRGGHDTSIGTLQARKIKSARPPSQGAHGDLLGGVVLRHSGSTRRPTPSAVRTIMTTMPSTRATSGLTVVRPAPAGSGTLTSVWFMIRGAGRRVQRDATSDLCHSWRGSARAVNRLASCARNRASGVPPFRRTRLVRSFRSCSHCLDI